MSGQIVGIGLTLLSLAGGLFLVGHHDGVLGSTGPSAILASDGAQHATLRVIVQGSPQDAANAFETYRERLILPGPMATTMDEGTHLPVRLEADPAQRLIAYLRVTHERPDVGSLLVVTGSYELHLPLDEARLDQPVPTPLVFIRPDAIHEPVLFKH